jgi:pantoate--beta-alanine ligase
LKIAALATVRENDGLARSSRNAYLTPAERAIAPALYRVISALALEVARGDRIADALGRARRALAGAGFAKVDYVELRDAETLAPFDPKSGRPGRVLAAAWLGKARLIDNVAV